MKASWAFAAYLLLLGGAAGAQEVSRGALLYDTHCVSCHREGLPEREDLIEFLDATHYRLDLRPRPGTR